MDKKRRQQKIIAIINTHRITTQGELAARMERAGIVTTQSSLSRDLEELGAVKQNGRYVVPHTNGNGAGGLLSLEAAGEALIVAKCEAGLASAVALTIDRATLEEVIGTLAGEDTVFIAARDARTRKTAIKKIWQLFG